jgi:hypothetical protein
MPRLVRIARAKHLGAPHHSRALAFRQAPGLPCFSRRANPKTKYKARKMTPSKIAFATGRGAHPPQAAHRIIRIKPLTSLLLNLRLDHGEKGATASRRRRQLGIDSSIH